MNINCPGCGFQFDLSSDLIGRNDIGTGGAGGNRNDPGASVKDVRNKTVAVLD